MISALGIRESALRLSMRDRPLPSRGRGFGHSDGLFAEFVADPCDNVNCLDVCFDLQQRC
jgi:hypothetical protein